MVEQRIDAALDEIEAASQLLRTTSPLRRFPVVALINESTVPNDWTKIAAALQLQAQRDFMPVWGTGCTIIVTDRAHAPAGSWWLVILDNSDMAGALGYHETTPEGLPIGKVFARTDLQFGLDSAVTASHELLEMLADPYIDTIKGVVMFNGQPRIYACEVCDPVEADALGYLINGVRVSDFVTPAWFHPGEPGPYSFRQNVTAPLQLARGGYISWLTNFTQGWQQTTARTDEHLTESLAAATLADGDPRTHPQVGSRRWRRLQGPAFWLPSRAA